MKGQLDDPEARAAVLARLRRLSPNSLRQFGVQQ
jgi:hypothetical protein